MYGGYKQMNPFLKQRSTSQKSIAAGKGAHAEPSVTLLESVTLGQVHAAQQKITSSPYSADLLEIALATAVSLIFAQHDGTPVWMLAVGNPSSDKTESALSIAQAPEIYCLDTMTENSFIKRLCQT
jgi:hypothetical protein